MSIIKDTFFGGAEKDAGRKEAQAIQQAIEFQKEQAEIGRGDIRDAIERARSDISGASQQAISDINPFSPISGLKQLQEGPSQAAQTINRGAGQALDLLSRGRNSSITALQNTHLANTDILNEALTGALRESNQGFGQGIGALTTAGNRADTALGEALTGAQSDLNPFIAAGQGATNLQAALSGALGREAQQQAYNDFLASPGQDFLREEQERAILRNASATGGLQGPDVLEELQRRAAGRAALDFDNAFNRLSGLSSMGGQSANNLAALRASLGTNKANAALTVGQGIGSLAGQRGAINANLQESVGRQLVDDRTGLGLNTAELNTRAFGNMADLLYGNSRDLGNNAVNQAGEISGFLQGAATNKANFNNSAGINQANLQQVLGTGLANIATGTGSQVAQLMGQKGEALASGILGQADARRNTINGFLGSSTGGSILSKIGIPGF